MLHHWLVPQYILEESKDRNDIQMEDWEESHIDKNLPSLVKNTRCTTTVKSLFRASGILTEEEVEILTAAGDHHGAKREAKVLYAILKTRRGAYRTLLNILEETRQTGALAILKAGQNSQDLQDNEKTMLQHIMAIPVELFGSVQSLRQHFPGLLNQTVLELLNCKKVKRDLAKVIQSDTTLKLTPDLPELHALYIPRAISNRLLLDPDIFKRNCSDIFVFKGVDPCALVDLVIPHVIRMSTTQLSAISCQHIYLDDDEDWDDLVLVAKAPLHLVYKDTDGYILQRSTQVTNILHEHWLYKTRKRDAYVSEDKFVSQFIAEQHEKGALICDVPGMGKTWLMQSIARRVQLLSNRTVVLFIQLDSFAKYLAELKDFSEVVDTLSCALHYLYDTRVAARIMSLCAEKNELIIVFVFDGFDEVSHVHIKNMTAFLKNLSAIKYIRLIISSRPNMRAHLEQTFNLISYDILPFAKQEQVASIVNRWQETILVGSDKELSEFAAECIDSFKVIRQKDRNDILGVPLQCYLLAVVNETSARQVSNPNRKKEFVVHETAKVESICELYTLFFNGLIYKGLSELNSSETCQMQTVEMFHTHKALELLFPEIAPVFLNSFETETSIENFARKLGVLCQGRQSKLEFIHRSFAEFLAGKFFAEFWTDIKSHDPLVVQSVGSYFITNVMKPRDEAFSPKFINYEYKIQYALGRTMVEFPKHIAVFGCFTVLWFMNSLYRKETEENGATKIFVETLRCQVRRVLPWSRLTKSMKKQRKMFKMNKETVRKYSYINIIGFVNHGFSSLLCLLVSLMKAFFKDSEWLDLLRAPFLFKNQLPDLPFLLCYISAYGCPENASELFKLFGCSARNYLLKFCMNYPEKFWTPLEVAISLKKVDMVLFFNHTGKRYEKRLLRVFLESKKFTKVDVNTNRLIMEIVFGSLSKILSGLSVRRFELFSLYTALENLILLAWTSKHTLKNVSLELKKNFLKGVLYAGTDEGLIKLLLLLFPSKLNDSYHFSSRLTIDMLTGDISECTAEAVLQNLDLEVIKMALPTDLDYVSPVIQNVETLRILISLAQNIRSWNKDGRNFLHDAVCLGKVKWVKNLIECGYDMNERDKDGNTPLHYVDLRFRGAEMTQILVNNGADVYAVNNKNQNFAHDVCTRIDQYWLTSELRVVPKWFEYLMEAGCGEMLKVKDCEGDTPLDVLSKELGTSHPITKELLTLLQTEGIISSL